MFDKLRQAILISFLILFAFVWSDAFADGSSPDERSPTERIEDSLKRAGKSIEEGVKNTAKKIDEKHIPEKIEEKLKHATEKTAEVIEKTGKHIEKKFSE